jgi:hypothetical protein
LGGREGLTPLQRLVHDGVEEGLGIEHVAHDEGSCEDGS